MASKDTSTITRLLDQGPFRVDVGRKQITLAFAGLYIAFTTDSAKPQLVWEAEKGYPRYYVPVDSLHQSIKSKLPGAKPESEAPGSEAKAVTVENVDTVKGTQNDASAVIERLSIGDRSTTWVRFTSGIFKDYIRFERSEIDDWFENGAIFAGIKNPLKRIDTTAVAKHITVKIDGEVVAETNVAVVLAETGLDEAYYIPATSIKDWGAVEKSSLRTVCPYKGEAWYFDLTVKGKKYDNIVWYYQYPTHESAGVGGFISFYKKDGVEVSIEEVGA